MAHVQSATTHRRRCAHRAPIRVVLVLALAAALLATTATPASAHETHVVQPGESLSVIAKSYGVSTAEVAAANGITNYHLIRVGQTLSIPVHGPSYHEVQAGDSVSVIAKIYGVSSAEIVELNGLSDPNSIRIGQRLQLPSGASASGSTSAAVAGPSSSLDSILAKYPSLPSRIKNNPERLALVPSFEKWAAHYGVAPDLVMAVAYQESGWQSSVISSKGAIGVGQILPLTARWIADDLIGISSLDPYNPDDNIRMSARFLRWLIEFLGGETEALAGYYQGPGSVSLKGFYDQTQAYVANVQAFRWRFQPA